jgi:hypothetical protein
MGNMLLYAKEAAFISAFQRDCIYRKRVKWRKGYKSSLREETLHPLFIDISLLFLITSCDLGCELLHICNQFLSVFLLMTR